MKSQNFSISQGGYYSYYVLIIVSKNVDSNKNKLQESMKSQNFSINQGGYFSY